MGSRVAFAETLQVNWDRCSLLTVLLALTFFPILVYLVHKSQKVMKYENKRSDIHDIILEWMNTRMKMNSPAQAHIWLCTGREVFYFGFFNFSREDQTPLSIFTGEQAVTWTALCWRWQWASWVQGYPFVWGAASTLFWVPLTQIHVAGVPALQEIVEELVPLPSPLKFIWKWFSYTSTCRALLLGHIFW